MVIAFTKSRKRHCTLCCENAMYTGIANASASIPVSLWGMSFVALVQFKLLRRLDRLLNNNKSSRRYESVRFTQICIL